jgi:hypothetical protein
MKTNTIFSALEQNSISNHQLNTIRGGTSGGGTSQLDEDILLYDPVPEKKKE